MKYLFFLTLFTLSFLSCNLDDTFPTSTASFSVVPCDSIQPVVWADTLKVVPNTISKTIIKRGQPYAGKTCWQAMLSSDGRIAPTNFQNNPKSHRVVIGDTLEITNESIFFVSRIK